MKKHLNRQSRNCQAPAINRGWKRLFAVGCSHGHLADKAAIETVLEFKKRWKPHTSIHLGDFCDLSALMGMGKAADEVADSLTVDFQKGMEFLKRLEPATVFLGNHEDRVWKLLEHRNELISYAAHKIASDLEKAVGKLGAELVPYDIDTGWRKYGDCSFGHGYMCNEAAIRDHAEFIGKCCIAHLHRPGISRARRHGGATGICVGTLANIPSMAYAKLRKARSMWNHGFVYGEYCEGKNPEAILWLVEKGKNGWRLPL